VSRYDKLSKDNEEKLNQLFSRAKENSIHLFNYMVRERFDIKEGDGDPNKLSSDNEKVVKEDESDGFALEGYFLKKASTLAGLIKNDNVGRFS